MPIQSTISPDTKCAIILPLYGYFRDVPSKQLGYEEFAQFLSRIGSSRLHYVIPVFEKARTVEELSHHLLSLNAGGNVQLADATDVPGVPATYGEYLQTGFECAMGLGAQLVVVVNPWVLIREGAIDVILEALNKGDASIVSGFPVNDILPAYDIDVFDSFEVPYAQPTQNFSMDFWGLDKTTAQLILGNPTGGIPSRIDNEYLTKYFMRPDLFAQFHAMDLMPIQLRQLPFLRYEIDWKEMESQDSFNSDSAKFLSKWGFTPEDVKYL